ncbi:MAG: lipopolysaccharide biosynthesis protein [Geminicoccaceae bacterium]
MNPALLVDSLWVLLTRLVMRAANFLVFVALARALTTAEFGFYGYVITTALILSVSFDLGFRQSGAWLIGKEPHQEQTLVTHLALVITVAGAVGVLVCWLMLRTGTSVTEYGPLALLAALNVAPMLCLRTGQGVFLGRGELGKLNRSELISRAVVLLGTLGLWGLGRLDLTSALWALLAAHVSAAAYLFWQIAPEVRLAKLVDVPLLRRLFRHGLELWIALVLMILLGRIGFWIVGWQLGDDALGLYFGVQRLGEILVEVATAVGVVIFSHGVRAKDARQSAGEAVRVARLVTSLIAVLVVACMFIAAPLLHLALGAEFATQAWPFRLVMLGTIANCFTTMLYPCLSAQGLARWGIAAFAAGVAMAALAFSALTPLQGLVGAGIAYMLAQLTVVALLVAAYRRRFGFSAAEVLLPQREDLRDLRLMLGHLRSRVLGGRSA